MNTGTSAVHTSMAEQRTPAAGLQRRTQLQDFVETMSVLGKAAWLRCPLGDEITRE